jgi:hypothetical protein
MCIPHDTLCALSAQLTRLCVDASCSVVQSFEELRAIDYALHEKETGRPLVCERKVLESARFALCRSYSYEIVDEAPRSFTAVKLSPAVVKESVLTPDGVWRLLSLSTDRQCRVRVVPSAQHSPTPAVADTKAADAKDAIRHAPKPNPPPSAVVQELRSERVDAPVDPLNVRCDSHAVSRLAEQMQLRRGRFGAVASGQVDW